MTVREREITRIIKGYDRDLFVGKNREGVLCIYRKSRRFESFEHEGVKYLYAHDDKSLVFPLTDNWISTGKPREWGLEVILARLKALDLHRSTEYFDEIVKNQQLAEESSKRTLKNNVESFLIDFRRQFSKTFDGVNTALLDKTDSRKLKGV